jgi:hypothetical protein
VKKEEEGKEDEMYAEKIVSSLIQNSTNVVVSVGGIVVLLVLVLVFVKEMKFFIQDSGYRVVS